MSQSFHDGSDQITSETSQQQEKKDALEDCSNLEELRKMVAREFIEFTMGIGALRFGEFKTKAGRLSPYFFNAGLFNDGAGIGKLASFYADRIAPEVSIFDMFFGPAYKGIPIVSTTTAMLAMNYGRNFPYAYNRKEAKDHGEGGTTIGAPIKGKVLIIDDVISAGTSVRESVEIIRSAGAEPAGVLIALDREERGQGELSAVQEVRQMFQIPVFSIASLEDVIAYMTTKANDGDETAKAHLSAILFYKAQYGVYAP